MILERQSSLKYQSRVVRYLSSPTLAIGSIEGRVAIEFLHDEPKLQPSTPSTTTTLLEPYIGAKRYAFKCHRLGNLVHTVNAIVRHPIHGNTDNNNSTDTNNMIVSAGWDRMFHLWDVRQSGSSSSSSSLSSSITKTNSNNNNNGAACSIQLPGKAFSMDVDPTSHHNRVVIATSGRKICIIDLRMMTSIDHDIDMDDTTSNNINNSITKNYEYEANMILERQSSLKYQSRVVRYLSSPTLAIGSIEGRVAIEFLHDEPKLQPSTTISPTTTTTTTTTLLEPYVGAKRYAFKCHRLGNLVHTVNAIVRHPIHGTFATGGSDGTVSVWDGMRKKRLSTLIGATTTTAATAAATATNNDTITKFETGISDLAFKNDGTEIAIAASYAFEEGERDHPKDEIYIRKVLDSEVRPKALSK